jgi:hypothetical protein
MESGEPVSLNVVTTSMTKLARLAWVAEQFGYEYADLRGGGGANNGMTLLLVPAADRRVLERAARNRALFPEAARKGPLPPYEPEEVELLKARMMFDLTREYDDRTRLTVGAVALTVVVGTVLFKTGANPTALLIVGAVWASVMALLPVGLAYNRRSGARYAARLESAGYVPLTDPTGRVRYVPPGRELPGHGNPFA